MRALLVIAAIVAAATAAAAPASASWHEQRLPSANASSSVGGPALATNARGDTAVAWRAGRRTYLAARRAGAARFGRRIALPALSDPRVAVLSDGTVLVATLHNDGTTRGRHPCCGAAYVQALRPGTRGLSPARVASARGAGFGGLDEWSLVAGPGGRAALAGDSDSVQLVTSRGRGVFGVPLSASQGRYGNPLSVAFGGDGRGIVLWVEGSNHEQVLRGAPIHRDGGVGAPQAYVDTPDAASDFSFFAFDAGLDRRSRLTALWLDTGALGRVPASVAVATGTTSGPLGARQVLDGPGALGAGVAAPELAVAPDGRALAVWRRYGGDGQQLGLAVRSGPGTPFRSLAPVAGRGFSAHVALLSGGRGMLVSDGPGGGTVVRAVGPGGGLGTARRLRGAGSPTGASVVAGARRITVAWGTSDGLHVATSRPG